MYKCKDCKEYFEEPKEIDADDFYGVSGMFTSPSNSKMLVCPYCDSDYDIVYKCENCERYFTEYELDEYNGMELCESCIDEEVIE